jgi:putative salt-induced outer membrane protein YdiY
MTGVSPPAGARGSTLGVQAESEPSARALLAREDEMTQRIHAWLFAAALWTGLAAATARADEATAPAPATDTITLTTGESLTGKVVSRTEKEVVFEHSVLGKLTIPASGVRQAASASGQPVPVAPEPPPAWKYTGELGVNGTKGTVDNQDLRAAVEALYESTEHRWKFTAGYQRSKTEDAVTKQNGHVDGLKDFLYPGSPWFWFLTARQDWDDFQIWDSRFSGGAGVGYTAYDTPDFKLRFRAGPNYVREFGVDEVRFPDHEDSRWEAMIGAESEWQINEAQKLEGTVTYYPDLSESGEYRVVGSLAWSINLNESGSLAFKLGLEDEYDTHREDPIEKNELKYFAALLFKF